MRTPYYVVTSENRLGCEIVYNGTKWTTDYHKAKFFSKRGKARTVAGLLFVAHEHLNSIRVEKLD